MRIPVPGFAGGSYTERSVNISSDRTVNLLPVIINSEVRPVEIVLVGTPGLRQGYVFPTGPIRMLHTTTLGRVFVVADNRFYELFSGGQFIERGQIPAGPKRVSMDDNGVQAMLVDGQRGWVFTFATNAFQQITDIDFPGADFVTAVDGYFVFNIPGTGRFGLTGLFDPLNVDGLDIATAEARGDILVRPMGLHRELRLFGTQTTENWFNSGNPDFPFEAIQGTVQEQGLLAADSLVALGNTFLWLHGNAQGMGKVLAAEGYQPKVLSTPGQEQHWATYPRRDDAIAMAYTEGGHDFYVLQFPSGNATWVLDLTTGLWHERAYLESNGTLGRWRGQWHALAPWGEHLVSDYARSVVYVLDPQVFTDDGREIQRLRRFPHIRTTRERLFHHTLEVHVQQGTLHPEGFPRYLQLRWSNDGGYTYSDEHWRELGPTGHYRQRARWQKLGQARDRVYELRQTADGPCTWLNAFLDIEQGAH